MEVAAGHHKVRVSKEGCEEAEQTLELSAGSREEASLVLRCSTASGLDEVAGGGNRTLEQQLQPNYGELEISTQPPGAQAVAEDGKVLGTTPFTGRFEAGSFAAVLRIEGFAEERVTADLKAGEKVRMAVPLRRLSGNLTVFTDPEEAELWLDGINVGRTPTTIRDLPTGERQLVARKGNLEAETKAVVIPDQTVIERLELKPSGSPRTESARGARRRPEPIAHYPFDGSFLEVTGKGVDGTAVGDVSFVNGVFGMALSLDGVDDFVLIPNNPSINIGDQDFSFSGWIRIKPNKNKRHEAILCKKIDGSAHPGMSCIIDPNGVIRVGAGSGGVGHGTFSIQRIDDGHWHHFVSVRRYGHVWKLFLDGELENEADDLARDVSSDEDLLVGAYDSVFTPGQQRFLEGQIDDLQFFDRALTAPEIKALFSAATGL